MLSRFLSPRIVDAPGSGERGYLDALIHTVNAKTAGRIPRMRGRAFRTSANQHNVLALAKFAHRSAVFIHTAAFRSPPFSAVLTA